MEDSFKPDGLRLERTPVLVRELAADALRKAILTGTLRPGDRLVEATLAQRLGVSRPSVREALAQLSAEKLVKMVPNRGPSVAAIDRAEASAIYETLQLLHPEIMALFAKRANKYDVSIMRKILREFQRAVSKRDDPGIRSCMAEFFAVPFGRCGNPVLSEVVSSLFARVGLAHSSFDIEAWRRAHVEMTKALDAVEAGDPRRSREAVGRLLEDHAAEIDKAFKQLDGRKAAP